MVRLWDESQGARIYNVNDVFFRSAHYRSYGHSHAAERLLIAAGWARYGKHAEWNRMARELAARIIAGEE